MKLVYVKNRPVTTRTHAVVKATAEFLAGITENLTTAELELATLKQCTASREHLQ